MKLFYTLKTATKALATNRSRSILTILGVVIGVVAIILVVSLSQGATNLILGQIQSIGSRTIVIQPGRQVDGPSSYSQILTDSLKVRDLEAIRDKENVPTLHLAAPMVLVPGNTSYEGDTYGADVRGSSPEVTDIYGIYIDDGNFFTEEDIRQRNMVVVIGDEVRKELFGASDPINKKVKIKERKLRVIGVLPAIGQKGFVNVDKMIWMPYTTAQDILGINHFNAIAVQADQEVNVRRTVRDIEATLREQHDIEDPEKDDFHVETQADAVKTVGSITTALKALLISIAAISLVVGGVGIMNIMLVSVTERTREIGLRKAIGARRRDILRQFLFEAIILTLLGGLIGIMIGALFAFLISQVLHNVVSDKWTFSFPFMAAFIGILVSMIVGLVFGLYPARTAANKSPIEALRYE